MEEELVVAAGRSVLTIVLAEIDHVLVCHLVTAILVPLHDGEGEGAKVAVVFAFWKVPSHSLINFFV